MEASSANESAGSVARLTRGLAAANEESFREFHARYFDRLYRFLLVVTRGQEDEAQEALQQTLLRVLRYVRVFDSEDAFWCWLKTVARSAARDGGRKQRRYLGLLGRFAAIWRNASAERDAVEDTTVGAALEDSLAELAPPDRRLLESKYFEGRTVKEVSEASGLTEKAIESRLVRLRRELRQRVLDKLRVL